MKDQEIWKDVLGYEGYYQVSNLNRARSLDRIITYSNGVKHRHKGRILKIYYINNYCTVHFSKENKLLHIAVWEAFNGPVPEGYEINHIDENPSNATLSNLNLMTHKENLNWGTARSRLSASKMKKVVCLSKNGDFVREYDSQEEAAKCVGLKNQTSISLCCNKDIRYKTAGGFKWEFADEYYNRKSED